MKFQDPGTSTHQDFKGHVNWWFLFDVGDMGHFAAQKFRLSTVGKTCELDILPTPPKFNSSPLKNGGWKTSLSHWQGNFSGAMLNFGRVCLKLISEVSQWKGGNPKAGEISKLQWCWGGGGRTTKNMRNMSHRFRTYTVLTWGLC